MRYEFVGLQVLLALVDLHLVLHRTDEREADLLEARGPTTLRIAFQWRRKDVEQQVLVEVGVGCNILQLLTSVLLDLLATTNLVEHHSVVVVHQPQRTAPVDVTTIQLHYWTAWILGAFHQLSHELTQPPIDLLAQTLTQLTQLLDSIRLHSFPLAPTVTKALQF